MVDKINPQDYGLIFYHGIRPLYFVNYKVVKEQQTEHIEATLAGGGIITIHPYWSKKLQRMVETREAIYRQPKLLTGDGNYCPENCRWITKKENLKKRWKEAPYAYH